MTLRSLAPEASASASSATSAFHHPELWEQSRKRFLTGLGMNKEMCSEQELICGKIQYSTAPAQKSTATVLSFGMTFTYRVLSLFFHFTIFVASIC
jgi:hypothetical protein